MNGTDELQPEERMINAHLSALSEHFDSVQIFVSSLKPDGGTRSISKGRGNWFTRYGQVSEWCIREDERARIGIRCEESAE